MVSAQNLKAIATSMLTAGLLHGISNLALDAASPGGITQGASVQANPELTGFAKVAQGAHSNIMKDFSWFERVQAHAVRSTVSLGVKQLVDGGRFDQAWRQALLDVGVNSVASLSAEKIGQTWGVNANNLNRTWGDHCLHKIAHGLLGGTMGAIVADNSSGFASGAISAMVAEVVAEQLSDHALQVAQDTLTNSKVSDRDSYEQSLMAELKRNRDWATLSSCTLALLMDQNVDIVKLAAENIVRNFLVVKVRFESQEDQTIYDHYYGLGRCLNV